MIRGAGIIGQFPRRCPAPRGGAPQARRAQQWPGPQRSSQATFSMWHCCMTAVRSVGASGRLNGKISQLNTRSRPALETVGSKRMFFAMLIAMPARSPSGTTRCTLIVLAVPSFSTTNETAAQPGELMLRAMFGTSASIDAFTTTQYLARLSGLTTRTGATDWAAAGAAQATASRIATERNDMGPPGSRGGMDAGILSGIR